MAATGRPANQLSAFLNFPQASPRKTIVPVDYRERQRGLYLRFYRQEEEEEEEYLVTAQLVTDAWHLTAEQ